MAVELVTGYAGANHIGADEVRKVVRSLTGSGNYYCEAAPTVSMTDANTMHVTAHYAVCGGGVFRIEATDLTVTNGTQGKKRRDIAAVQYSKDTGTGVESASLVIVAGTPGTTATDPTLTTGDLVTGCTTAQFAIASLDLDGISVGTPTLMESALPTLDGVSASASDAVGRLADIHVGGTVINLSGGTETLIWTHTAFVAAFGFTATSSNAFVGLENGDWESNPIPIYGAIVSSSGVYAAHPARTGGCRINYIVAKSE